MDDQKIIIKYFDEKKEYKLIRDYDLFLKTCYKDFDISEEEQKNLKIVMIDDDGDELSIENKNDFEDSLTLDNKELVFIIKTEKKKNNKNKIKKEENQRHEQNKDNNTNQIQIIKQEILKRIYLN